MKKIVTILSAFVLSSAMFFSLAGTASASFNQNLVMDDVVFDDSNSLNAAQIDALLNSNSSCISPNSGFSAGDPVGYTPSGGFQYGGNVSAGTVIAHAAEVYHINPEVLVVTLQKEQSLITSTSCSTNTISKAAGYGCPDSGGSYSYGGLNLYTRSGTTFTSVSGICVNSAAKAGFSQQVIRAAWLLKFSEQRSEGNIGWAIIEGSWDNSDDLSSTYSGYMTPGCFKRSKYESTCTQYDGYTTIDGVPVQIQSGPTAAFYRYTPHFPGNQNLVSLFEGWFGGTISASYYTCRGGVNIAGQGTGLTVVANKFYANSNNQTLSAILMNNTGSQCLEAHTWAPNYQQWITNVATNLPAIDPTTSQVISGDVTGDGKDDLILVKYTDTGSGRIEIHVWDTTYQKWVAHIATNYPSTPMSVGQVIAGDTDDDGKAELMYVKYRQTGSGKIEVHTWAPGYQSWTSNIATTSPETESDNGYVIAGNVYGEGRDRLIYVKYINTGSGKIEVHTWAPGYQSWTSNIATNYPATNPGVGRVIAANVYGESADRLVYVKTLTTGSGRIEVHTWAPGYQSWTSNIATNLPEIAN